MQKVLATALAIPIFVLVYAGALIRRTQRRHAAMALVAIGLTSVLIAVAIGPTPVTGTPPASQSALDPAEFTTIVETGESPSAPIVVSFPEAMNTASVERLLGVSPVTPVALSWDSTATLLTIAPRDVWASGTFHTVTVEAGALDATGRPLDHRVRAAFLTRAAVSATISASAVVSGAATAASHFLITFTGPIDLPTISLDIRPDVTGHLAPATDSTAEQPSYEFIPDLPLSAGVAYTVELASGARDAERGMIVGASATIMTAAAPMVVRFRPKNATTGEAWSENLSVRFTESMAHETTEQAWSASVDGKAMAGSFTWAEDDTVLVFDPAQSLGFGQSVVLEVNVGATSKAGLALATPATATFTTAPHPTPARPSVGTSASSAVGSSSGSVKGTIGSSTWSAVEAYYLRLMNCTRTGGLVTSSGSCSSPGGRNVAALWQDAGITSKVSRPYAKKLAVNNLCTHFSGGNPGDRLKAAGYTSYIWAENLGCRTGDPDAAVLATHLFYQSEWSYNGGHYVNLMNADYDRVGIGIWVSDGRVRLVVDFYQPS